jgi:hypothetical protein
MREAIGRTKKQSVGYEAMIVIVLSSQQIASQRSLSFPLFAMMPNSQ